MGGINPGAGRAVYQATNVPILDFHYIVNALFGGGPSPEPGFVSFEVRWSGTDDRVNLKNPSIGFAGEYVRGQAQMEWTARVGDFHYVSDPIETSSSQFAQLGHERNGSCLP